MKILKFLKTWNEAWLLLICIPLIPVVPFVLRFFDETAAPIDAGVYHTLFITILAFGVLHLFTWIGIYLNFGAVWSIFQKHFIFLFRQITPWQKLFLSYLIFALYLLSVLLTFTAVAGMV